MFAVYGRTPIGLLPQSTQTGHCQIVTNRPQSIANWLLLVWSVLLYLREQLRG